MWVTRGPQALLLDPGLNRPGPRTPQDQSQLLAAGRSAELKEKSVLPPPPLALYRPAISVTPAMAALEDQNRFILRPDPCVC